LDDRHIVRRMVLKKSIFGVDKNLMAVELAKTALWLHTFTVGAPLSFLDHHLKHGDSLHGERLPAAQQDLQALGMLFQQAEMQRLELAAKNLGEVADLTDVDIAEAQLSKRLSEEADDQVAPLHALLDFWRAMRWLQPGWPPQNARKLSALGDDNLRLALSEILSPARNLVTTLGDGKLDGQGPAVDAANALLQRVRALAKREKFFHWWTAFPTAFAGSDPGFDAVIGNPPWDRIKLQEVEWFAERDLNIASQARAADRKALIDAQRAKKSPLAADYAMAVERAEANTRVLAKTGDFPLLGGGDVNLYSLFVERAQALVKANGVVAILTPSGIAADKGAAEFFKSIATTGRLGALFDFENRKVFFADVDSRFKFSTLMFGGATRKFASTRCAFFLHALDELDAPERTLMFSAEDFARVNPNTGAAPVFRSARDATITMGIYERQPVLVRHANGQSQATPVWPVEFATMFHMTNDSTLFLTAAELRHRGYAPTSLSRWQSGSDEALPLYEGKMVQAFDHRAADIVVNAGNLHRAAQPASIANAAKVDAWRVPAPQYWISAGLRPDFLDYALVYKDVTAPTNMRTMTAAVVPGAGYGNTLPILRPTLTRGPSDSARVIGVLVAMLNSFAYDFVARQKVQGQHLNWFIVEQLPVISVGRFEEPLPAAFTTHMRHLGLMNGHHAQPTVADFVIPQVLALSYTAHDLAPFACDLGYVNDQGEVLPPFVWNDEDRRARLAALDALFFYLYGINEDDAAYMLDTFPIVRQQDEAAFGRYRTKDDVLALLKLLPPPQAH
jgi:hypothetical protein